MIDPKVIGKKKRKQKKNDRTKKTSFHQISQHHHYNEMHDRIFHTCSEMPFRKLKKKCLSFGVHYGCRRTAQWLQWLNGYFSIIINWSLNTSIKLVHISGSLVVINECLQPADSIRTSKALRSYQLKGTISFIVQTTVQIIFS